MAKIKVRVGTKPLKTGSKTTIRRGIGAPSPKTKVSQNDTTDIGAKIYIKK